MSFNSATYLFIILLLTRQVLIDVTRDELPKDFQCSVQVRLYTQNEWARTGLVYAHVSAAL